MRIWLQRMACLLCLLLLMVAGAHQLFIRYIVIEAQNDAVALGRWMHFAYADSFVITSSPDGPVLQLAGQDPIPFFSRISTQLVFFPIHKLQVFNQRGERIFSSNLNEIGVTNHTGSSLAQALRGEIASRLVKEVEGITEKGSVDIVETYLPLYDGRQEVVGAMELYIDVSHYRNETLRLSLFLGVIILGVGLVMYGAIRVLHRARNRNQRELGMIGLCSSCRKVRDVAGTWQTMEQFVALTTGRPVTHSYCPSCIGEDGLPKPGNLGTDRNQYNPPQ